MTQPITGMQIDKASQFFRDVAEGFARAQRAFAQAGNDIAQMHKQLAQLPFPRTRPIRSKKRRIRKKHGLLDTHGRI